MCNFKVNPPFSLLQLPFSREGREIYRMEEEEGRESGRAMFGMALVLKM